MSDEVRKWLVDILEAIDHIDIHLGAQRDSLSIRIIYPFNVLLNEK